MKTERYACDSVNYLLFILQLNNFTDNFCSFSNNIFGIFGLISDMSELSNWLI